MATQAKKDNSTLSDKVAIRLKALERVDAPLVVCEAFCGWGEIYDRCYRGAVTGVAVEKDLKKAEYTAIMRPSWLCVNGDSVKALSYDLRPYGCKVNFLDLDPYGSPFPVMAAVVKSGMLDDVCEVVINDGTRQKAKLGSLAGVKHFESVVSKFGADLYRDYMQAAREVCAEIMSKHGFSVSSFAGYYTGHNQAMTHYSFTASKLKPRGKSS